MEVPHTYMTYLHNVLLKVAIYVPPFDHNTITITIALLLIIIVLLLNTRRPPPDHHHQQPRIKPVKVEPSAYILRKAKAAFVEQCVNATHCMRLRNPRKVAQTKWDDLTECAKNDWVNRVRVRKVL